MIVEAEAPESQEEVERAVTLYMETSAPPPTRDALGDVVASASRAVSWYFAASEGAASEEKLENLYEEMTRLRVLVTAALPLVDVAALRERPPMSHFLKADPPVYALVLAGKKNYEVRKFDRDFRVGDTIVLMEHARDPALEHCGTYTGRRASFEITCITSPGSYGLPEDVGVLGIVPVTR
jgi:hypothetical protein